LQSLKNFTRRALNQSQERTKCYDEVHLQICTLLHMVVSKTKIESKDLRQVLRLATSMLTDLPKQPEMTLKLVEIVKLVVY
jgi:hypothetical protein